MTHFIYSKQDRQKQDGSINGTEKEENLHFFFFIDCLHLTLSQTQTTNAASQGFLLTIFSSDMEKRKNYEGKLKK